MELLHGFMSGIGQSIISHPFDTYKTWIQVSHKEKPTIRGLYRGFAYPAFSNSLISGVAFKFYEFGKETNIKNSEILGGLYAGVLTGLLSSVVEYKKIKEQLSINTKFNKECIITMLMREIPACIFYYPMYDYLKKNNYSTLLSGGIAGVTCWVSSYWADVLNTHVMSGSSLKSLILKLTLKDYFRGILIVIPRAFFINASGYYFYELSKEHFC
jgi:hypothetical protein